MTPFARRDRTRPGGLADRLVRELALGRVRSVAFVVPSDVTCTLPLYDLAIGTARRGWMIGIPEARYWFVTPERSPLERYGAAASAAARQRLEPEGIAFIGSTYAEVAHGAVRLDPGGGCLHPDRIVTLRPVAPGLERRRPAGGGPPQIACRPF